MTVRTYLQSALSLLAAAGLLNMTGAAHAETHGCATARQFAGRIAPSTYASARTAVVSPNTLPGRVLVTPHFALHYTAARSVHQPVWTPADAPLKRMRDSLYAAFANDTTGLEARVNAALDSLGAAHPAFVVRAGVYFENAYAYFVDTLGMIPTDSNVVQFFKGSLAGKYNVDIGDIQGMEGSPKSYGVTFKPVAIVKNRVVTGYYSARMLIDNDFLYNATLNDTGMVSGTPIVNEVTRINYNNEWDKGLAVTIAHEYYHAIQLKYTPTVPGGFHSWYELGAVAMEERLAPTVDDYLSYLDSLLPRANPVSLYETGGSYQNYANGIFHIFLSHKLGKAFDVLLWQTLGQNGNQLPAALVTLTGSEARWDSLYAAYAASLAIAGLPGSAASPLAFSPDFPLWPRPHFDTVGASGAAYSVRPLTYRLIAPAGAVVTQAYYPGIPGAWRVSRTGTEFPSQYMGDSLAPVTPNGTIALAVANSSFASTRALTLKRGAAGTAVSAFPNPASRASTQIHFFTPTSGSTAPLSVVSESGRLVATLTADPTGSYWKWNFRDLENRVLPPGIYHYRTTGAAPQTLLVLP